MSGGLAVMAKRAAAPTQYYHVYRRHTWVGRVDAQSADDAVARFRKILPLAKNWKELSAFQERRGRA